MPVCIAASCTNGSMRTPNGEVSSISPVTGLRTGTRDQRRAQLVGVGARQIYAQQRALEAFVLGRQFDRDEWTADRRRRCIELYARAGEHAADLAGFAFVAVLHLGERERLPPFDAIERSFEACRALSPMLGLLCRDRQRDGAAGASAIGFAPAPDRAGRGRIGDAAQARWRAIPASPARRIRSSSFCSNCSWSSNWRLVVRSIWARNSAMRSS